MHLVCSLPPPLPSDSHQLVMRRAPQLASGLPINPPGCCQSAKELVTVPPSDKILQKISISQDRHFRKQRPSWVNPLLTCFCKAVCLHFSTPLQMTLHSREMPTPIHALILTSLPKAQMKGHFNHEAFPSISRLPEATKPSCQSVHTQLLKSEGLFRFPQSSFPTLTTALDTCFRN